MTAELLNVSPDEYHRIDAFSSSLATTLLTRSPLHARAEQTGERERGSTKSMDVGTVAHALVLGKGKRFAVLDFANYKTKAAQEARDASAERGITPILRHEMDEVERMVKAVREQLDRRRIVLDGISEAAIRWTEQTPFGDVACRGMLDHLVLSRGRIYDFKFCADASPAKVERSAESYGYAVQAAAYTRAVARLRPDLAGRIKFSFVCVETDPPYAMNVCEPDGVFREIGETRWLKAVAEWGACLQSGEFRGYGTNDITAPAWALIREGMAA